MTTPAPKRTTAKSSVTTPQLSTGIFAVDVTNHELLKLAYDSYLANARLSSAVTKRRGEVRGGGKKPWKQKGTGRARFGSSRNPIWRGGGVVFGPLGIENYTKRLSKGAKHVALRQALTLASKARKITILDITATGKTKDMATFLRDNNCDVRRVLMVVDEKTPELLRSTKNLQSVELVRAQYLTVFHILNADRIVITPAALAIVEIWLAKDATKRDTASDAQTKIKADAKSDAKKTSTRTTKSADTAEKEIA